MIRSLSSEADPLDTSTNLRMLSFIVLDIRVPTETVFFFFIVLPNFLKFGICNFGMCIFYGVRFCAC